MRVDMHLPTSVFCVFSAALLQDMVPVTETLPAKIVFLTGVALYAMLAKPLWVALTVTVWAGGLTDALGGLPLLCTSGFLLVVFGAVRLLQRVFLEATLAQGMLLTACVAVCQWVWTRLFVSTGAPFFVWQTAMVLGYAALGGLVAGFFGFALCGWADRMAGIVKPAKEGHGILWAETNR